MQIFGLKLLTWKRAAYYPHEQYFAENYQHASIKSVTWSSPLTLACSYTNIKCLLNGWHSKGNRWSNHRRNHGANNCLMRLAPLILSNWLQAVWVPSASAYSTASSFFSAGWLVDWCLMALSAETGYIVPQEYEIYHVGPGDETNM